MYLQVKILEVDIFTHAPWGTTHFPRFLLSLQAEGNDSFPTGSIFFFKFLSPSSKVERRTFGNRV